MGNTATTKKGDSTESGKFRLSDMCALQFKSAVKMWYFNLLFTSVDIDPSSHIATTQLTIPES